MIKIEQLNAFLSSGKAERTAMGHLYGCSASMLVSSANIDGLSLVACKTDADAEMLTKEIEYFSQGQAEVMWFPDEGVLPYDTESIPLERYSQRMKALHCIRHNNGPRIIVTSYSNLLRKRIDESAFPLEGLLLKRGIPFTQESLCEYLSSNLNYMNNDFEISEHAQFCATNNVVDIFPMGYESPIRVTLAGNMVELIQTLDINSFLPVDEISEAEILTSRTYPWESKDRILKFKSAYREEFMQMEKDDVLIALSNGEEPAGMGNYLDLLRLPMHTLLNEIHQPAPIFLVGDIEAAVDKEMEFMASRFNDLKDSGGMNYLPPERIWETGEGFRASLDKHQVIRLSGKDVDGTDCEVVPTDFARQKSMEQTIDMIEPWMSMAEKTVFAVQSSARVDQIKMLLRVMGQAATEATKWSDVVDGSNGIYLCRAHINRGCFVPDSGLLVIDERAIFGQPIVDGDDKATGLDFNSIRDLKNLEVGDPVVHEEYGVGRFAGLETMHVNGSDRDFVKIRYAEDANVFVSIWDLDKINRYGGLDQDRCPLHLVGSDKWKKDLSDAREDAEATAAELMMGMEDRMMITGIEFNKPNKLYNEFCNEFPYRETRDQLQAIQDIIEDMRKPYPMDRVICGDVGFGKTEVAMRAACLAAISGYQTAVMAPTTLLAEQHFHGFRDRFEKIGKTVVLLSSSLTKAQERKNIALIESGEADIVVGTQSVLMDDITWPSLGLMIVDEEHRFGVNDKKLIQEKRANIDSMTMTATPIPRTMTMGLQGVRGFSIIATPPAKRLSVRTLSCHPGSVSIKEGLQRELNRNGQAFVLHNNTKTIQDKVAEIEALVPGIRVAAAHGKMKDAEISRVMKAFINKEFDVLVATTIIEIGIDVPNANTIFIEKAHNMGLAQLHQLRGRVGRSHRQAYCYLVVDEKMNETQQDRIKAVTSASRLGEGFVLAYYDMEIRGAGNLLGEKQSGNIQNVGFNLYMSLLSEELEKLRDAKKTHFNKGIEFDMDEAYGLDEHYITNSSLRLSYYKRILSAKTKESLAQIQEELESRFGGISENAERLLGLVAIRNVLSVTKVKTIRISNNNCDLYLSDDAQFDAKKLDKLEELSVDLKILSPSKCNLKLQTGNSFSEKIIQLRYIARSMVI